MVVGDCWLFVVLGLGGQHSEDAHVHHSCSHQVHVREGSELVVGVAVSSEMLEFKVLFSQSWGCVGSQPDIAVGDLGSWRVGPRPEPEPSGSYFQIRFSQSQLKDQQGHKNPCNHRFLINTNVN